MDPWTPVRSSLHLLISFFSLIHFLSRVYNAAHFYIAATILTTFYHQGLYINVHIICIVPAVTTFSNAATGDRYGIVLLSSVEFTCSYYIIAIYCFELFV